MASINAVNSLLAGDEIWKDYLARNLGTIDLTFADLKGADLSNRILERCDFSGAQLQGANLDRTTINSCKFIGANLSNVSLVQCELCNTAAHNMIAEHIIIRNSKIINVELTRTNMSSAIVDSTVFQSCIIMEIQKDGISFSSCNLEICNFINLELSLFCLQGCTIKNCNFREFTIDDIQIHDTTIESSAIDCVRAKNGSVDSSRFIECFINEICIGGPNIICHNLDFSRSTLSHVDLILLGLDTVTMLDTSLTFCNWPKQQGHVSVTGKYIPSQYLLSQPVQDLKGVPPLSRREIADAQYIVWKIAASSIMGRIWMRLWGIFTGFGQSLERLTITTFGLIILATICLLVSRSQLVINNTLISCLVIASRDAFNAFFAFTNIPDNPKLAELIVIVLTRICGFLVLGFWVTIVSNKLSRLGSD